jgi:hypothetical protein
MRSTTSRARIRLPLTALLTASLLGVTLCVPGHAANDVISQLAPPASTHSAVRIGVLGLFHPHQLVVCAVLGTALVVHAGEQLIVLEPSSGADAAHVRMSGDDLLLEAGTRAIQAPALTISGRRNDPVDFILSVPGKITRHYRGLLEVTPSGQMLIAVVTMDRETAVASVVAAETAPDTPVEALKAQAVAVRSYFAAGQARHHQFDFCDTTHCQFLREPPPPDTIVSNAVATTRNLVLTYDSQPFAAMYTRSCSGRTHTPAELGLSASAYPYYSVACQYCRAHPARWSTRISANDAATLHPSDELARLNLARRLGWSAIPSNDFTMKKENAGFLLEGTGQGHGTGLCQSGAKSMAQQGATFRQILSHYYPNTMIVTWPGAPVSAWRAPGPVAP